MAIVDYNNPKDLPAKDYNPADVPKYVADRSEGVREAKYGAQNKEFIAQAMDKTAIWSQNAIDVSSDTSARQDALEQYNDAMMVEMTDKDVISAPEIIQARGGKQTLGQRLDDTTAQLAQVGIPRDNMDEVVTDHSLSIGDIVITRGFYDKGDKGGGRYEISATETTYTIPLNNGLHAKLIPDDYEVNIRQLGAHPDLADNGPYIRSAITLHNRIYLTPGSFRSTPFTLGSAKHLYGAGTSITRLRMMDELNEDFITLLNPNAQTVEQFQVEGNKSTNPFDDKALVKVICDGGSSYNHILRNLYIRKGAGFGLHMTAVPPSYNWVHSYTDIMIEGCRKGFYDYTTDNKFNNFYISGCDQYGLYSNGGSNLYNNFKIDWCGGDTNLVSSDYSVTTNVALNSETITGGLVVKFGGNLHFTNLDVQSAANVGIKLISTFGVQIRGSVNNCGTAYTKKKTPAYTGVGVDVKNSSGCVIDVTAYSVYEESPQAVDIQLDSKSQGNTIHANEIKGQFLNILDSGLANRIIDGSKYHLDRGGTPINYTNHTQPSAPSTRASDANTILTVDATLRTISATGSSTKGAYINIPVGSVTTDNEAFFFRLRIKAPFAFEVQLVKGDDPYEFIKIGRAPNRGSTDFYEYSKIVQSGAVSSNYAIRIITLNDVPNYSGTIIDAIEMVKLSGTYGNQDVPSRFDMLSMYKTASVDKVLTTQAISPSLYR